MNDSELIKDVYEKLVALKSNSVELKE